MRRFANHVLTLPLLLSVAGCAANTAADPGGGASERITREPAGELEPATIELAAAPAFATQPATIDRERDVDDLRAPRSATRQEPSKCEEYTGLRCYWMENTSGNYCWVPATWASDKGACYALDSCDGGLGQSGGGCYKWAAGTSAPRHPW